MSYSPSSQTTKHRSATRISPFYRDLASPICSSPSSSHHRRPSAAVVSSLAGPDLPPPPPLFTLDDRAGDLSPDSTVGDLPPSSPSSWTPPYRPFSRSPSLSSPSPSPSFSSFRIRREDASNERAGGSGSGGLDKGKGSPVEGVVESDPLVLHQMNGRQGVRLEPRRDDTVNGTTDKEQWVTVFGFYPSDTNLVLREFDKCGVILRHVTGPRDANWIHVLYQNRYDARRALEKNGMQINGAIIIGVKPVDQIESRILNERLSKNKTDHEGFMVSLPLRSPATRPRNDTVTAAGPRMTGNIAAPAKSVLTKALDLVFGI